MVGDHMGIPRATNFSKNSLELDHFFFSRLRNIAASSLGSTSDQLGPTSDQLQTNLRPTSDHLRVQLQTNFKPASHQVSHHLSLKL
ncbi:hypothetical protein BDC45DRAFT_609021 [Circinella umbellata]|nr:hypothetical protein BDC45DRAFT_609021 [Circinella umbellata]